MVENTEQDRRERHGPDQGGSRSGYAAAAKRHAGCQPREPARPDTHQRWSDESDPPRPVYALAQDHRGYLWAATATGLFRFDGIRFESVSTGVDLVVHGAPSAILIRRNGEVWTNFKRSGRFAVYRDGQLRFLRAPAAPHRVISMHETRDGTVWVLTERVGLPLMRYRDGRWTSFGTGAGAPLDNPYSMVVTGDGTVWVSFNDSVMRLGPGGQRLELVRRVRRGQGAALSRSAGADLAVRAKRNLSYYWAWRARQPPDAPPRLCDRQRGNSAAGPFSTGREIYGSATYYNGLERLAQPDPRGAASSIEAAARVEHYTARDGLSSNATTQIFQDAEGNVWAATENGLDKFWPATLHFDPQLSQPAAFGDLLLEASDGTVYIGEASTVYRVRPGKQPEPILRSPKRASHPV